jgi:phosphoserine phosphatase RsbU/P
MSRGVLKQIIGRQPEVPALVSALAGALDTRIAIEDPEGRLLHGEALPRDGTLRFPVNNGAASIGWVSGLRDVQMVASLLEHLVGRETERKALGAEVLHLYREINLIYSFSEKLAALLDVERVARLTLQEARHLIVATDGLLLVGDEAQALTAVASFGDEMSSYQGFQRGQGIIGAVAASGIGEIVNDIELDARRLVRDTPLRALIAAPLKVGERVLGVIALGSTMPMSYTAAELKLLNTLALQAATAIENARLFERAIHAAQERERLMALHQEAEVARAKLENELDLAARIQADLFPSQLPRLAGYEIAARNRPARRCGGDYYDALPMAGRAQEDGLLLCVADVAGKGLPAALVMSNMQATLRALLGRMDSIAGMAEHASRLLFGSTPAEKYVTAAFAAVVPATGALTFVGAGHLDNLILRANGGAELLESTGMPLGLISPGLPYGQTTHALEAGDTLVLFSDGVTDAQNSAEEDFGDARLLEVLRASTAMSADSMVSRVFDAIDRFTGLAPQFDDMTMLVLKRTA